MHQLTLRIPDRLSTALKEEADRRDESVNAFATAILSAAVDPDLEEDGAGRLRARLARAGLLEEGASGHRSRPPAGRSRVARQRAAGGRSLSELVREGRG